MPDTHEVLISILKQGTLSDTLLETYFNKKKRVQTLFTLANLHGITPQCYKAIKDANLLSTYPVLQQSYQSIVQANLLLTAHLLSVTQALEKNDLRYLAIKGSTLSQELYGDISMRQFSDIDLFVDERDIYAIAELILSLGYVPVHPLSLLKRKKFLELDNDFSFRHIKNNALLELHWKLFPLRHQMPLDFQELYANSKEIRLQNREIKTLSVEENLLYLSLHGAKHIFERYEWVYDLHMIVSSHPEMDLEKIYFKAKKEAIDVPFLLGLFLSHTLFETILPESLFEYKNKHIQTLVNKTIKYYEKGFVYWDESDKKRNRFLFLSLLFQKNGSQTLWLIKSLLKTTPADVITFNLPDRLAFLYPLLRPFRLLYKHLFTKKPVYRSP